MQFNQKNLNNMENLIKRLENVGTELYRKFGTESYELRCELYDISVALQKLHKPDVSGSVHLHCVLNPHYDNKGRLDGGTIISGGKITGHIDPSGEEGCPGVDGITDYGYDGVRTDR